MNVLQKNKPVIPDSTFAGMMGYVKQGIARRLAKFAGYQAAHRTPTTRQGSRIGTNPNSTYANLQRVAMFWTAEDVAKNSAIAAAYLKTRMNYCSAFLSYIPDTGDPVLDTELTEYLKENFKRGGINCSFFDAFSRIADVEQPVRGDSMLIYFRDETQLRVMEVCADQVGNIYQFTNPVKRNDGTTYYAGIYCDTETGQRVGFDIKERVGNWYGSARFYPAQDCLYFQDNIFNGWRGITTFANALRHMDKGEELFQIGIDAAMRQAKTAFILSNERGQPDEQLYDTEVDPNTGQIKYSEQIGGGPIVEYLYNGDSMTLNSAEAPGPELIEGVQTSDERVALSLGLSYAFLINGSKVGGAPSRFDTTRAGREIERIRSRVHLPKLESHSYITIMDAIDRRIFPPIKNITRGCWHFGNLPTADAFRDSMDDIKSVRAGQESDTRVLARYGTTPQQIMREKESEVLLAYSALDRVNKRMEEMGIKERATIADIRQVSDNPQQVAQASIEERTGATNVTQSKTETASMSAFIGDIETGDLPIETQESISKILGNDSPSIKVAKYGMTVPELIRKADPHNLETAQRNIRYQSGKDAAQEVHENEDKHILLNNDRIIDGHHFLAKAIKGKVSKSLPVIDLTPARFQNLKA